MRGYIRYIIIAAIVLLKPISLSAAAEREGGELLRELSENISKLGRYEVNFSIDMKSQESSVTGSYHVDAERYMLDISGAQIYGDGEVRYSVDSANKEVVIERLEGSMPMIILNPAVAFISLDKYFDAEVIVRQKVVESGIEVILIDLRPKQDGENSLKMEGSVLALNSDTKLPCSIAYAVDGEIVTVLVTSIKPTEKLIPSLSEIEYPAEYEIIDLR